MKTPFPVSEDYAEIRRISALAAQWIKDNPDKPVEIVWKVPSDRVVIGVMRDAIKIGIVRMNENAMELLAAMGVGKDPKNEPSVIMIRVALDLLNDE